MSDILLILIHSMNVVPSRWSAYSSMSGLTKTIDEKMHGPRLLPGAPPPVKCVSYDYQMPIRYLHIHLSIIWLTLACHFDLRRIFRWEICDLNCPLFYCCITSRCSSWRGKLSWDKVYKEDCQECVKMQHVNFLNKIVHFKSQHLFILFLHIIGMLFNWHLEKGVEANIYYI